MVDFSIELTRGQNYYVEPDQKITDAIMLFAPWEGLKEVDFRIG